MPLYEYECDACGNRFERIQKFSDPLLDTCPSCAGRVRKLISSPAIQFKGSGWYITDYAKKTSSDSGKDGKEPAPKEGAAGAKESSGSSTTDSASSTSATTSTTSTTPPKPQGGSSA